MHLSTNLEEASAEISSPVSRLPPDKVAAGRLPISIDLLARSSMYIDKSKLMIPNIIQVSCHPLH